MHVSFTFARHMGARPPKARPSQTSLDLETEEAKRPSFARRVKLFLQLRVLGNTGVHVCIHTAPELSELSDGTVQRNEHPLDNLFLSEISCAIRPRRFTFQCAHLYKRSFFFLFPIPRTALAPAAATRSSSVHDVTPSYWRSIEGS